MGEQPKSGTPEGGRPRRLGKKLLFTFVAVFLVLDLIEGFSSFLLGGREVFRKVDRPVHLQSLYSDHDVDLGWVTRPGFRNANFYRDYGEGLSLTINSRGFRGPEIESKEGRYRIVCVGDSFTLGHGVGDEGTYPRHLARVDPRLQTVNLGQAGYGIGQALLWYERDGEDLEADLVILAFIIHDIHRTVVSYMFGAHKPRFLAEDGKLIIDNRPVPEPGGEWTRDAAGIVHCFATGRLFTRVTGLLGVDGVPPVAKEIRDETVALLLARARETCEKRGARLAVVLMPTLTNGMSYMLNDGVEGTRIVEYLRSHPKSSGIPILDLGPPLAEVPVGRLYREMMASDRLHFSSEGYVWVAERIDEWLGETEPGYPR